MELTAGRRRHGTRTTAILYGVILFEGERGMMSSTKKERRNCRVV